MSRAPLARVRRAGPTSSSSKPFLEAEVFARDASGARQRIRHAALPAHKTLEDFDFSAQPGAEKPLILHLAQLAWPTSTATFASSGRPAPARVISRSRWRSRPAKPASRRVRDRSAWVDRLEAAQHRNALDDELRRIERYSLIVVDEIGYLPLERQAANLLFALVARRYERRSIIVTSNRVFEAWGEILGDAMVAAALIDRLIHHAHIVTLKGKSYRLRERAPTAPAIHAPPLRAPPEPRKRQRVEHYSFPDPGALFVPVDS